MSTYHLYPAAKDDFFGNLISQPEAPYDYALPLQFLENELLSGDFKLMRSYFDNELCSLRKLIDDITSDKLNEITIEFGYNLTSIYAAYYAVINSPNVVIKAQTAPNFGGPSIFARTHPRLLQKLIYNVIQKAKTFNVNSPEAASALLEAFPRLDPELKFPVVPARIPDEFVPVYLYMRGGIAVFCEFEPNGGIDMLLAALAKASRLIAGLDKVPITIIGAGDMQQSAHISQAFPNFTVIFNAPLNEYVKAAASAEVVVLPDIPSHAGPTKELFVAMGSGAAIIAHENSAAADYAGTGASLFSTEGDGVTSLLNALLRTLRDPAHTFGMMAEVVRRRRALRNPIPTLLDRSDLLSSKEAELCQDNAATR